MSFIPPQSPIRQTLSGIGVSPGYAIGRAYFVDRRKLKVPHVHLEGDTIDDELARFHLALDHAEQQIQSLKTKLKNSGDEHYLILDAHQMILRDAMLVEGTQTIIREQRINAEWALKKVMRSLKHVFDNIDDEYFQERRADIGFVGDRILRNLLGKSEPTLSNLTPNSIIIARDLSPADTAQLVDRSVLGFVTEVGSRTSHTAIMARSLEIPAVVAIDGLTELIGTGDTLVVDGSMGRIHLRPTPKDVAHYERRQAAYNAERAKLESERFAAAKTLDGMNIQVVGNIERPEETHVILDHGAAGVGLYRTEFLFMNRETRPTEDEQYACYRKVVETCSPHYATIRTLDLGGDKLADFSVKAQEANPVLGLRAIRLCVREYSVFKTQIRALLRASVHGDLRIMVPLISRLDEILFVKDLIAESRRELTEEGIEIAEHVPLGIMIEVPAAALMADHLAREVDFFSVGTNDLIQYTLAVDRQNPLVAHLYAPLHPSILVLLQRIQRAAQAAGIEVNMCGEMAGEALCLPVVLGLGFRTLSMNPSSIPLIKAMVRSLEMSKCESLVDDITQLSQTHAIEGVVRLRLREMVDGTDVEPILESLFDDPSVLGSLAQDEDVEYLNEDRDQ